MQLEHVAILAHHHSDMVRVCELTVHQHGRPGHLRPLPAAGHAARELRRREERTRRPAERPQLGRKRLLQTR
ncbi:unnamed protein product [Leptidea sinapis]|uniref:Uncharacterized protein n=1 Tax=Leptidea sinapis TaxID=189913 RepID=A0A5E4QA17_9NEOP|nr:unnamed protein product [Leptidea sinapis]